MSITKPADGLGVIHRSRTAGARIGSQLSLEGRGSPSPRISAHTTAPPGSTIENLSKGAIPDALTYSSPTTPATLIPFVIDGRRPGIPTDGIASKHPAHPRTRRNHIGVGRSCPPSPSSTAWRVPLREHGHRLVLPQPTHHMPSSRPMPTARAKERART